MKRHLLFVAAAVAVGMAAAVVAAVIAVVSAFYLPAPLIALIRAATEVVWGGA